MSSEFKKSRSLILGLSHPQDTEEKLPTLGIYGKCRIESWSGLSPVGSIKPTP